MDAELDRAAQHRLAEHEHRYTPARRALVSALAAAGRPMTLPDLLASDRALAQSSAYRNLSLMEGAGVVRRLVHGTEHAYYELAEELTEHHHHLICEQCGMVRDVTFDASLERTLGRSIERIAGREGFLPRRHTIDVYGRCADCAA